MFAMLVVAAALAQNPASPVAQAASVLETSVSCIKPPTKAHKRRKPKPVSFIAPPVCPALAPLPIPLDIVPPEILPYYTAGPAQSVPDAPITASAPLWGYDAPLNVPGAPWIGGGGDMGSVSVSVTQAAAAAAKPATIVVNITNKVTATATATASASASASASVTLPAWVPNHGPELRPPYPHGGEHKAPEISGSGALSSLTLLAGIIAVMRGRRSV